MLGTNRHNISQATIVPGQTQDFKWERCGGGGGFFSSSKLLKKTVQNQISTSICNYSGTKS